MIGAVDTALATGLFMTMSGGRGRTEPRGVHIAAGLLSPVEQRRFHDPGAPKRPETTLLAVGFTLRHAHRCSVSQQRGTQNRNTIAECSSDRRRRADFG